MLKVSQNTRYTGMLKDKPLNTQENHIRENLYTQLTRKWLSKSLESNIDDEGLRGMRLWNSELAKEYAKGISKQIFKNISDTNDTLKDENLSEQKSSGSHNYHLLELQEEYASQYSESKPCKNRVNHKTNY